MNKILYISLTGMTEPLGRSQVMEYLVDLSGENKIYLVSFERESDEGGLEEIQILTKKHEIEWKIFRYSNRYGVLSSLFQVLKATRFSSVWIKYNDIKIVHARSMIPATIGLLLKKIYDVKFIYDIRGFAVDEKVDSGRLKKKSLLYHVLKRLEIYLYRASDRIVTLTYASKKILYSELKIEKEKITVIPTCASKNVFKKMDQKERNAFRVSLGYGQDDKLIVHTGSVSGWYDFESEVVLVKEMMRQDENVRFIVVNRNEQPFIRKEIDKHDLPSERVLITSSSFDDMYKYLGIADASLFFITPSYSKQASAPTKFAENVACFLPSITNSGVGDMERYLSRYKVGYIVSLPNLKCNLVGIVNEILRDMCCEVGSSSQFDDLFKKYLDKNIAINRYQRIYNGLADNVW